MKLLYIIFIACFLSGCAAPQYHCEQEGQWGIGWTCNYDSGVGLCHYIDKWHPNGKWDCLPMEGD